MYLQKVETWLIKSYVFSYQLFKDWIDLKIPKSEGMTLILPETFLDQTIVFFSNQPVELLSYSADS